MKYKDVLNAMISESGGSSKEAHNKLVEESAITTISCCSKVPTFNIFYRLVEKVEIPEGVTTLYYGSFDSSSPLKAIILPVSLVKIKSGAIRTSTLTDVYYRGTIEQWNEIDVDLSVNNTLNYPIRGANKHFNYTG